MALENQMNVALKGHLGSYPVLRQGKFWVDMRLPLSNNS